MIFLIKKNIYINQCFISIYCLYVMYKKTIKKNVNKFNQEILSFSIEKIKILNNQNYLCHNLYKYKHPIW